MSYSMVDNLYTYADYKTWGEDKHIEIIDGAPIIKASSSTAHQYIDGRLSLNCFIY